MWFLALLLAPTGLALTHPRSGLSVDLAAGPALTAPPGRGWGSAWLALGWWDGTYDDSYAIGRYWSVQLAQRLDLAPERGPRLAPSVELRRGLDLVVVGWYFALGGGPSIALDPRDPTLGAAGRLAFGAEFRRTRFLGLSLRLEGGPEVVGGAVGGGGALLLGGQFSRPLDGQGVD